MKDFLAFRTMITPIIIQVIFWVLVGLCILGGLILIVAGAMAQFGAGGKILSGLLLLVLGPLGVRIYCEILIIFFRINETLTDIKHVLEERKGQ